MDTCSRLLDYLKDRPGQPIRTKDAAAALGISQNACAGAVIEAYRCRLLDGSPRMAYVTPDGYDYIEDQRRASPSHVASVI